MTRKHYKRFAAMLANMRSGLVIQDAEDVGFGKALVAIEDSLCEILARDNPRFDEMRFRDAAQPRNAKTQGERESQTSKHCDAGYMNDMRFGANDD